ncbi:MAG: DUF2442 domain-containing protein [Candidatus Omnitrophota bacterium]
MHWIIDVQYIGDYRVRLKFENNEIKEADLQSYLNGRIFEPLRDIKYFRQVSLNQDIDTIVWPNNADFSPDFLYEISQPLNQ